jgi:hypothetical protein
MKQVHIVVGVVTIVLSGASGLYGAWCWWRAVRSVWFWRILRTSQAAVVVQALLGGVLLLMGRKPPSLHVLYGVLPLLVSFFAEQFRIASTQMVLDQRGFESAQEVGKLPADEQQAVVGAVLQREVGVMVLAALVNVVLLGRAAMTG